MRPRRAVALTALAVLGLPAACSDDGPGEGEARLEVDGLAVVERAGGERETVDDSTVVHQGDRVSIDEGAALMRLSDGTVLELREGLVDDDGPAAANTALVMGTRPVLEAGDLLVTTEGALGLEVDGTDVEVTEGAARLTRAFGMSVAAYDADVQLDSAGVLAEVPALRQMVVPDLGRPPQRARPVAYDPADRWDRRFLGAAMALGDRLESIATGLTNSLPDGEGRTVGFFRLVLPGLEDESAFDDDLLAPWRDGRPGDTLIGAAITDLGERGDFADRWDAVFDFHEDGAAWGIVALDQAVRSAPLVGTVEDALGAFADASASAAPPPDTAPGTTPTTAPTGPDDPGSSGGPGSPSTPTTQPPTSPPTSTPPVTPPPDVTPALEPVLEPVTDLVDDLVGGLLGGLTGGLG